MSSPLISIILPTRNRLSTIRRTVDHILAQTVTDWELVISDNASDEDGKVAYLRELEKSDSRIKLHLQEGNIGIHANWRFCIEKTSGRYYIPVTDDDWWGEDTYLAGLLAGHDGKTGSVFPNMCIHHIDTGEVIEKAMGSVYGGVTDRHSICELLIRDARGVIMVGLIDMTVVPKEEIIGVIDNDLVYNIETVGMNRIARTYPVRFCEEVSYHHTAYSGNFCRSYDNVQLDQDRGIVAFRLLDDLRRASRSDEGFAPAFAAQWEAAITYCCQMAARENYNPKVSRPSGEQKEKIQALRGEIKELRAATATLSGALRAWWSQRRSRTQA
jgi:glycosyltransferase involved in cell wall biosynthesis